MRCCRNGKEPSPSHHSMEIAEAVKVVQTASDKISFQSRFIQATSGNNCLQTGLLGQPILTLRLACRFIRLWVETNTCDEGEKAWAEVGLQHRLGVSRGTCPRDH